ncbi:hypothetical protein BJV77DRAFT_693730 [Russula vinacea]|nr:hypothetical protein BJV77DRAFT_693730 [Russula vinacea]
MMFSTANHVDVLFLHPCSLNTRAPRSTFGKSLPRVLLSQVLLSLSQVRLGLSQKLLGLSRVLFSLSQALLGLSKYSACSKYFSAYPKYPSISPFSQSPFSDLLSAPTSNTSRPSRSNTPASDVGPRVTVSDEGGLDLSQRGWDPQNLPRFLLSATPFSLRRPTCRPV